MRCLDVCVCIRGKVYIGIRAWARPRYWEEVVIPTCFQASLTTFCLGSCRKTALCCYLLGWPKSLYSFFHKAKSTFFIFTNNFIDLDILSMSALSHIV